MTDKTPQEKHLTAAKQYLFMKGYRAGFARARAFLVEKEEGIEYLEESALADLEQARAAMIAAEATIQQDKDDLLLQNCPRD